MSIVGTRWRLAVVAGAVLALATGCGDSSSRDAGSAVAPQQKPVPAEAGGAGVGIAAGAPADAQAKPGAAPAKFSPESRSLIFNGTITQRVSNVERAAREVSGIATAAGGFVGGDDRTADKERSQARLTLRVPSAKFAGVIDDVSKIDKHESRKLSTEDVTDQVVDLEARISTGQASVNRVRELLARAQTIGEITSLESELSRREADLESLKSRKARLDDLTTLSTITAVLLGPEAAGVGKPSEAGFLAGLKAGWNAFVTSMQVLLTVLGALLPWLVIVGVPAVLILVFLRRLRRRAPDPVG